MSNTLPITLVAALVAGGVGAFAATAMRPAPGEAEPRRSALDPSSDLPALVQALSAQNEEIVERLRRLESTAAIQVPVRERAPAAVAGDTTDLDAAVAAALARMSTAPSGAVVHPDFRKQVETVLEIRAEEERQQREIARVEREQQMLEERLARLQTELGLDKQQVEGMRKVFQDAEQRRETMRASMRDARDGTAMDMRSMRDTWQQMNDATNLALQGILTPVQYEQYQASNPERGDRGRGFMAGGEGGPPGSQQQGGRRNRNND